MPISELVVGFSQTQPMLNPIIRIQMLDAGEESGS